MSTKKIRKRCFLCLRRLIIEKLNRQIIYHGRLKNICEHCFDNAMVSQNPRTLSMPIKKVSSRQDVSIEEMIAELL